MGPAEASGAIAVIFRSRLRPDAPLAEYAKLAGELLELARRQPGFVSFKSFAADDGERVSLVEFATLAAAQGWRDHPAHREAQALGRAVFYSEYRIQVCAPIRDYAFPAS